MYINVQEYMYNKIFNGVYLWNVGIYFFLAIFLCLDNNLP